MFTLYLRITKAGLQIVKTGLDLYVRITKAEIKDY